MQRADPQRLRQAYKSKVTPREAAELGIDLAAGSDHYRGWVGPPCNYDINGGMQLEMLFDLGLREYHSILEIGCGSLRLGRLLLMYLLPDRYFGVEPNRKILAEGMKGNLGGGESGDIVRLKRPRFSHSDKFDFGFTGRQIDYVIAQSIVSHTGIAETEALLQSIASICHEASIAIVTYIRCEQETKMNHENGWFYPDCVMYTDEFMGNAAKAVGLLAYRSRWPLTNEHPGGLVTSQVPLILTKKPWRPTPAHNAYGLKQFLPKRLA
jgi:SAM-dependent methyltransferase